MIKCRAVKRRQKIIIVSLLVVILLSALVIFVGNKKVGKEIVSRFSPTKTSQENALANNQIRSPDARPGDANANIPQNLPAGVNVFNLKAVDEKSAQATALIVKNDGEFVVDVETTLSDPPGGVVYSAWLVKKVSDETLFLGKLKKSGDKYILSSTQSGDIASFKLLIITQETRDDNLPEKRIFEKSL